MSGHTPGPWIIDYDGTFGHIKSVPADKSAGDRRATPTVARYDILPPDHGIPGAPDDNEQRANAHLIGAAPDLLSEHRAWSSLLGKLSVAAAQHDWSEVKRLLAGLPVEFHSHDGAPAVESAAILKATQVAA